MKTIFVHPERCIGCKQCEIACATAHSLSKNLFWAVFETPTPKPRIHTEPGLLLNTAYPNQCRHCNPAPCQSACPTGAIHRPSDFPEIVLVEPRRCIACGMCAMVCPFDAITYYPAAIAPDKPLVAIKCDRCIERQRQGDIPACVEACKVGALEFGELNEMLKTARMRTAERVLQLGVQFEAAEELAPLPVQLEIWRAWGASVSQLNANGKKGA